MLEIKIPELGESIQEVQIAHWLKLEGQWVEKGEDIVELESEKASQALPSPSAGILQSILFKDGQFVKVGQVIARIDDKAKPNAASGASEKSLAASTAKPDVQAAAPFVMPAAERLLHEHQLAASSVQPTGPGGRILKEDVQRAIQSSPAKPSSAKPMSSAPAVKPAPNRATELAAQMSQYESEIANNSAARQETVTSSFWSIWSVWFVWFVWLSGFSSDLSAIRLQPLALSSRAEVDANGQFPIDWLIDFQLGIEGPFIQRSHAGDGEFSMLGRL